MGVTTGFRRIAWVVVALAAPAIAFFALEASRQVVGYEAKLLTSDFPELGNASRQAILVDDVGFFYFPSYLSEGEVEQQMRATYEKALKLQLPDANGRSSIKEFAAVVRKKHPEYASEGDVTAVKRALTQYPAYRTQVNLREYEVHARYGKRPVWAAGVTLGVLMLLAAVLQAGISVLAWIVQGFRGRPENGKGLVMHFRQELNVNRWLACFDLLGTRNLLSGGKELNLFVEIREAIRKSQKDWAIGFRQAWFSDTFLIVAPDDSDESFERMDRVARFFANDLLFARIPFRGAIACDRFYADFTDGIFFGNALAEAYEYGEGQDWIGLLLCPSASRRLESSRIGAQTPEYYAQCEVPWKRRPAGAPDSLATCIIGNWLYVNGRNPRIESLREMMSHCSNDDVRMKYVRTVQFLESHSAVNA